MTKYLHIVCLDVPWPPDYGGAIDMFNKIRALSGSGVRIILHCFEYGRGQSPELEAYCEQVFYYPRKKSLSFRLPYIVLSRKNRNLISRLTADDHPVLLEGVHCTYYLHHGDLRSKNVWVRLHNVESEYYHHLAIHTNDIFKKAYFSLESYLLKRYEKQIASHARFVALSHHDRQVFADLGALKSCYVPLFAGDVRVTATAGKGSFCLYHGNLSVPENEQAVAFLIRKVFSGREWPLVIAGKKPSIRLKALCSENQVKLIADPDQETMDKLLKEAHIHILPALNATGIKVKLLYALTRGRFVITNKQGTADTSLSELCNIADDASAWQSSITRLWDSEFTLADISRRQQILDAEFDPAMNAQKLVELIFAE